MLWDTVGVTLYDTSCCEVNPLIQLLTRQFVFLLPWQQELLREIEEKERKSDRDQELEITWEPGLRETTEYLVTSKMKEKERREMTPWESYLQTKKEKRKEKQKGKEASKNK